MERQEYFRQALANFTFETASGGAIRHLADHGYTVGEISKRLDFPTPFDRIQNTVWKHFLDKGILLLDEPGTGMEQKAYDFVAEYDRYGRKSFRRVTVQGYGGEPIQWTETVFCEERDGMLSAYLLKRCDTNQKTSAYVSCDFGLRSRREPERFGQVLEVLEKPEQDYIRGLPWERRMVYHSLDERMRRIVARLYENGEYQGWCYFTDAKEKVRIGKPERKFSKGEQRSGTGDTVAGTPRVV